MTISPLVATAAAPPLLRIREPDSLIAAVPHLLGFTPEQSLVVVLIDDTDVVVVARYDLAQVAAAKAAELFMGLLVQGRQHGATRAVALLYGPFLRARRVYQAVRRGLGQWLDFCLVVDLDQDCWWPGTARPTDPGIPLKPNPSVEAWARRHDWEPVGRRDQLGDELAPPRGSQEDRLIAVWAGIAAELPATESATTWSRYLAAPTADWSEADFVTAAQLVHRPELRDQLWLALTTEKADDYFAFWSQAVRCTPLEHRLLPLAVVGLIAWLSGRGGLFSVCHEECLTLAATGPVVDLLTLIRRHYVHPEMWSILKHSAQAAVDGHRILAG
ncbi:MAG: DUF4192 domain-containing protein [Propionibacteriaceae bacterium]|jgi:hypothetical protein|nr:DUF4192 domain-containing protein [Propionibacteriaceae bacterium]